MLSFRRRGIVRLERCLRVRCAGVLFILLSPLLAQAETVWKESSFADFADGAFDDAGANIYVSAGGRIQTVNRWDFNGDGYIDILCPNSHPLIEMLDMSIYWGNSKDFSIERHSYVPANGPMWVAPGDLNGDGHTDLAVANFSNGTWTSMDSAVYWNGFEGARRPDDADDWSIHPFEGRNFLPSQNAQGVTVADLDNDGLLEIIFAFSAGFWEYRGNAGESASRIYWNSTAGFDRERFTELGTRGATDVDAADFDGDGFVDLAFANGEGESSYIFHGSADGFSSDRRSRLPTLQPHAVKFADVDNDGALDVLFANESGSRSVAYLNRNGSFKSEARIDFETHNAKDIAVADFNNDGYNDVFFTNHIFSLNGEKRFGNRLIPSYLYWGDEGGFSTGRRSEIQTIGAWGTNAADFNNDGWVDLLVCNFQEHYSYEVPSFVYWNGPEGFSRTRRTPLYEHGAQGNAVADFNGDGHLDILITSMMGASRGDYDPSYLYVGNRQGAYSVEDRIVLPGREPYEQAMADLDDDGKTDVLLLNQGEVTRWENEVWIHWNENNELDPWRVTGLPAYAGVGVEVVDLDRDGYLDIIVASNKSLPADPAETPGGFPNSDPGSFIYWGSKDGYVITERTKLNIYEARSPSIADLNSDGFLDLVFAGNGASIFYGDGTRNYSDDRRQPIRGTAGKVNHQTEVADLNKDGYFDIVFAGPKVLVYYGDAAMTYAASDKVTLEVQAKTMNVADVNDDGWLDLVCPLYKEKGRRSLLSSILLGGPDGFSVDRRIELPTDSGTGAIVSDFNFDGHSDIFFFCHRKDGSSDVVGDFGDHRTDSRLYWGSAGGFDADRYLAIPTIGVHYDVGMDLGHIRGRGFEWSYQSSPRRAPSGKWRTIRWRAGTPGNTAVRFQVRTADSREALQEARWTGPRGADSYFEEPGASLARLRMKDWVQYRAIFDTHNGAESPILDSVEIRFGSN